MKSNEQKYLTLQGAVLHSGISEGGLRGLIRRGELTAYRPLRGRILIKRTELEKLILDAADAKSTRGRKPELANV